MKEKLRTVELEGSGNVIKSELLTIFDKVFGGEK